MKRKEKKNSGDPRVNTVFPIWLEFIILWFSMLCLATGQAAVFYSLAELPEHIPLKSILAIIGYWGIMSASFNALVVYIRRATWDKPMRTLSAASRRVTEGDFSVRLAPRRSDGKKDYAEVMYEDFNIMVEELASTETMKSDFIANVSHEIKTPLAIIQNYADALRDPGLSWEEHSEYTDTIVTASQKLNTLVANILKLSKLENQEITPAFTRFDLCRQLGNCVLSFESLWERKGITFEADMDDRAVINSDPELLEIVWNNLLSNALKFTEPGGSVTLTQTSEPDGVTVAITDTGCGMDEHTTPRIFDKFYQGDLSRGSEGNGLGLALVARVSEILGAHIGVKSKPDSGTTFTVILKTGL